MTDRVKIVDQSDSVALSTESIRGPSLRNIAHLFDADVLTGEDGAEINLRSLFYGIALLGGQLPDTHVLLGQVAGPFCFVRL